MPTTSSSAVAVNISRKPVLATHRNKGRSANRPPTTTAATAPSVISPSAHGGLPPGCAPPPTAATASSGRVARIGMTDKSWNNSTAKHASPPGVLSSPFSPRDCSTMAVEDMARINPAASPVRQSLWKADAAARAAAAVSTTCKPPSPSTLARISHSRAGRNSKPMRNSITTTPNSPTCSTWSAPVCSLTSPSTDGPMHAPAIR